MVYLVENPSFVVVDSVVLDSLVCEIFAKSVNDFNRVKHNRDAARGAAGYVVDFVGLNGHLHDFVGGEERHLEVPAWLGEAVKNGASLEVDSNVALVDSVQTLEQNHGYHD